jgi:hypothetical protein
MRSVPEWTIRERQLKTIHVRDAEQFEEQTVDHQPTARMRMT